MYSLSNDSLTQRRILNSKQFLFITLKITVSFSIPMYRQQVWDQCDFLLVGKLFLFRYFEIIFLSWHYINFVRSYFSNASFSIIFSQYLGFLIWDQSFIRIFFLLFLFFSFFCSHLLELIHTYTHSFIHLKILITYHAPGTVMYAG